MLSIVSTLYYSENYIEPFYERLKAILSEMDVPDYEIILVNDGSPDASLQKALLVRKKDNRVKVVDLSKNFGHHQAIRTGLEQSQGNLIFLIDSDLEEPPELLKTYLQIFDEEKQVWDVIYGIQASRKGKAFEKQTGSLFYKLLNKITGVDYPADSLTARLMTRQYVEAVLSFPEKDLELWSVFLLAGFRQKAVISPKSDKGSSTYTFAKKLRMAFQTLTGLTEKPLYWIFFTGIFLVFVSLLSFVVLLIGFLLKQIWWYSWLWLTLSVIILVTGIIVISIGIVGIYLAKILTEVRQRPISIIKHLYK